MATTTKRIRERIKNASGDYDIIHRETEASLVLTDATKRFTSDAEMNGKAPNTLASANNDGLMSKEFYSKLAGVPLPIEGVSTILNDTSWAKIREISDAGLASNYWRVGDAKQIIINGTIGATQFTNQTLWAIIIGFDHNSAVEGANRIHFQIGRSAQTYASNNAMSLVDAGYANYRSSPLSFVMNPSTADGASAGSTNSGGWNGCTMRNTLLGSANDPNNPAANTFLAALPADLRAIMKPCTKYSDNTGGGSNTATYVTATTDYLFLLAEWEVHGARTYANSAEQNYQKQYDYYKNGNSKIKYRFGTTGATTSTAYWWLRSVYATYTTSFCRVSTGGGASGSDSGGSHGVAPGFCV